MLKDSASLGEGEEEAQREEFRNTAVVKAFKHGADEILHLITRVRDEEGNGEW